MRYKLVPALLFTAFLWGCSDNGPSGQPDASDASDAGGDDAYDAGDDAGDDASGGDPSDAGADDRDAGNGDDAGTGDDAGDLGIGDDYALVIPPGTQVCSDKRSTWDVYGAYRNRMRITFIDGTVVLPKGQPTFERDWISSIEYTPDKTILQPSSAGIFTMTQNVDRDDYEFVQTFTDGNKTYTLTYKVWFDTTDPNDRVRVFDEAYLSPYMAWPQKTLDLAIDGDEFERWYFLTCTFDLYIPVIHRVQTADGAQLELEERWFPSSDHCILACPTGFLKATFNLGIHHRPVEDPFRLAFVDGQHNWFDRFIVAFDSPVTDIHALHFFPHDNNAPDMKVDYLDADLNIIRETLVTDYTTVELWFSFDSRGSQHNSCTEYCNWAGLADSCEASCTVDGQPIAGRCLETGDWPPTGDTTVLETCDTTFDTCTAAGRPFVQCCCARIGDIW
jgi:hypothetical protein